MPTLNYRKYRKLLIPRYLPTLPEALKNTDTDRANTSVSSDNSKPVQHQFRVQCSSITPVIQPLSSFFIQLYYSTANGVVIDIYSLQVSLDFTEEALAQIAHIALQRKTGARGLRAIMVCPVYTWVYIEYFIFWVFTTPIYNVVKLFKPTVAVLLLLYCIIDYS